MKAQSQSGRHSTRHPTRMASVLAWGISSVVVMSGCRLDQAAVEQARREEVRQLTEHAVEAREMGETETADRYLRRALNKDPDDFHARCQLAEVAWEQGRAAAAVKELKTAREINPDSAAVHLRLGEIELVEHRFETALRHLDEALELDPANAATYSLRARALEGLGQREEAVNAYYRALQFEPRHSQALLGLSQFELAAGNSRQCLAKLRTVLNSQAEPETRKRAYALMGTALVKLQRWEEAAGTYEQFIAETGGSAEAYYRLAYAQFHAGKPEAARSSLAEVLVRDSNHTAARALEARLAKTSSKAVASTEASERRER